MQEDTSFRGDVIGLCISIKGRHTEGKGRHQQGLSLLKPYYSSSVELSFRMSLSGGLTENLEFPDDSFTLEGDESSSFDISTSASLDNTLLDLQNSSYPTKAEFNNCLLFIQNNSKFKIKLKHANFGRCKSISIMHLYQEV